MNELNYIQTLQILTQELKTIYSKAQSSTYSGRVYESLGKLNEHRAQIQEICQKCIDQPTLNVELNNHYQAINVIQNLLPPLECTSQKVTDVFHFTIFSTKKKINKEKIVNKISVAFRLSEEEIREQLQKSSDGFFVNAAHLCFDLANKRLSKPTPLDFKEVKAIHDALFDSMIQQFLPEVIRSRDFINPHPSYVFASLYKFLASVEKFDSCEDIKNQVQSYLETKPVPQYGIAVFLNEDIPQQKRTIEHIQEMARNEEEGAIDFLNSLEIYKNQLSSFQKGLNDLPIVDIRAILENSNNINQTYFLSEDGKVNWIFKPSSENESGTEIVQAECTASRLNYHHQFPIPLTIHLVIKDWVGSAQMYVEDSKKLSEIEAEDIPINIDQLQRLAIFDLLFANSDRNRDNFLFQNSDDLATIVGIDHDRCLMFQKIEDLKIDYLQLEGIRKPINKDLAHLFSSEAIQTYKTIMIENEAPGKYA